MVRKAKKRGVKPGTKRGPYKKNKIITRIPNAEWRKLQDNATNPISVGNLPSLMTELQSTISQLEGQLTAQIDRIKSILK